MIYQCTSEKTFNDQWLIERAFPGRGNGFYIECGAADGVVQSSSYCLERYFDWRGISLEANPTLFSQCKQRRSNICLNMAIAAQDGEEDFVIPTLPLYGGLTKNIVPWHAETCYQPGYRIERVKTISFPTLLKQYHCPRTIDFISMDVEGAEMECVHTFPFDVYKVQCWILEMSHPELADFLKTKGYERITNEFNTEVPWEGYFWLTS